MYIPSLSELKEETDWVFVSIKDEYYDQIQEGDKTIELRAPRSEDDNRYEEMRDGDILVLESDTDGIECFELENSPTYYDSVEELLENEGWENVVPEAENYEEALKEIDELPKDYNSRIEEHGVYAIPLKAK